MGLLPDVARDLSASIPQAGLLVSGYALGFSFGAPILAVAAVYVVGNALCALASSCAPSSWETTCVGKVGRTRMWSGCGVVILRIRQMAYSKYQF
jgi:predicted MFS family arabinose efflux permease